MRARITIDGIEGQCPVDKDAGRVAIESTQLSALWEKAFDAFKEAEDLTTGRHLTRNACDAMHDMWPKFGCILNELRANAANEPCSEAE